MQETEKRLCGLDGCVQRFQCLVCEERALRDRTRKEVPCSTLPHTMNEPANIGSVRGTLKVRSHECPCAASPSTSILEQRGQFEEPVVNRSFTKLQTHALPWKEVAWRPPRGVLGHYIDPGSQHTYFSNN